MGKALVLIIGAATYLWLTQAGHDAATAGLTQLQFLYTAAGAQAATISATANQEPPVSTTALAN